MRNEQMIRAVYKLGNNRKTSDAGIAVVFLNERDSFSTYFPFKLNLNRLIEKRPFRRYCQHISCAGGLLKIRAP